MKRNLSEEYSSLFDKVEQFDKSQRFWWDKAREIKKEINSLERMVGQELKPTYFNIRNNTLNAAREAGVYDDIPSLKERIKERTKYPLKIANIFLITAIPFSTVYYHFKYPLKDASRREKTKNLSKMILVETAKTVAYSMLIYSCLFGIPSFDELEQKKDNKETIEIIINKDPAEDWS